MGERAIGSGRSKPGRFWTRSGRADSGRVLIEIFLETGEDVPDLLGSAQIGNGIGNRVVIFEQEQRAQS